jgi:hypothetical protein
MAVGDGFTSHHPIRAASADRRRGPVGGPANVVGFRRQFSHATSARRGGDAGTLAENGGEGSHRRVAPLASRGGETVGMFPWFADDPETGWF